MAAANTGGAKRAFSMMDSPEGESMATTLELERRRSAATRQLEPADDLSRRLGGFIVVEYLMNLFGDSPKELFGRIDVLAVLDRVKNDKTLFPDAVIAISDRIDAADRTRVWKSPKSLHEPVRRKRLN